MPSKRLSTPPRFDRSPVVRGLGRVPKKLGKGKKTRLAEGADDEDKPDDKPEEMAEGDDDPDKKPDDPEEMAEGDDDQPEEEPSGSDSVDATGGRYGAGIIRRFSVISRGEALGHGFWIDATALQQCADSINASANGLKSRFTHPSLSGDGMGKLLGRAFDAEVDGDRVLADLHILQSAHDTPDGDLAGYVMGLAAEDPEGFGASIAFEHDEEAEELFFTENGGTVETNDEGFTKWNSEGFEPPDDQNSQKYRHMRLKELRAVDVVDEPAANPKGLFHREGVELLRDGEALLDFALGISEKPPVLSSLSIAPERLKGFLSRYAKQRQLQLAVKLGQQPAPKPQEPADPRKELGRFVERFGAELGAKWFAEGVDWQAAVDRHAGKLAEENAQLRERIKTALGETEPLSFSHPPKGKGGGKGVSAGATNTEKFASSMKLATTSVN